VTAITALAAQKGYHSVSIADVSRRAGVSSSTFYAHFASKEACLHAAYGTAVAQLIEPLPLEPREGGWPNVLRNGISALLGALAHNPDAARVVLIEGRAAGPALTQARERAAELLGERLEGVLDHPSEESRTLDIPALALIGGTRAIILRHLRERSEDELPGLTDGLLAWLSAYAIPDSSARWSAGPHTLLPAEAAAMPKPASLPRLPRGRHRLPAGVVARTQRAHVIQGTAEVMLRIGYANATVADIVAAAGVARDVFYEHAANKHDAFMQAQQHGTQDMLDACARAYFAVDGWPRRAWEMLAVLLELIAANPALAHVRLVECYAAGTAAVRRAEEIATSFTIFLEEGYRHRPEAQALPHLCSVAIAGAIFEIIQRYVAQGRCDELPRQLPLLTYVAIAPFTGPADAVVTVEALATQAARNARR